MKQIASFQVNHDYLTKGIYTSRVDGDIVTYDIRMRLPNSGEYLENDAIHTFEHLFATYARNTKYEESIVYVGPMGCRTGFYLLVRENISPKDVVGLVRDSCDFISKYSGEVPGATEIECGNAKEHSLEKAKAIGKEMKTILEPWTVEMLDYKFHEPV